MVKDVTKADRKEKSDESYDLYDGDITGGGIVDNPSIHIYVAFQIMDTEDEGEQYDPSDFQASTIGGTGSTTPTDASSTGGSGDTSNGTGSSSGTTKYKWNGSSYVGNGHATQPSLSNTAKAPTKSSNKITVKTVANAIIGIGKGLRSIYDKYH